MISVLIASLICVNYSFARQRHDWSMEDLIYTVRYIESGDSIAENYVSAIGALGRIGALIGNGIGDRFSLFCGDALLMGQEEIFDSLKITRH